MASVREAWTGSTSSMPANAAAVASPRTFMVPSVPRSTDAGVKARWCRPRARAASRPVAASPAMRRASSAGRPPCSSTCARVWASWMASSMKKAMPSERPTSSTRTSRWLSSPAARRAASNVAAAKAPSSGKQTSTTSRSSVMSWADQRSAFGNCSRRRCTAYRPPSTVEGPTPCTLPPGKVAGGASLILGVRLLRTGGGGPGVRAGRAAARPLRRAWCGPGRARPRRTLRHRRRAARARRTGWPRPPRRRSTHG